MDTAIYFSNDKLRLVTGTVKGGRIVIDRFATADLPEGALINGVITDEELLQNALSRLKSEYKLKSARIVIDSSNILTKRCTVPFLGQKQLLNFTKEELKNSGGTYENLIFDYSVLEVKNGEDKTGTILCCAAERRILERYQQLFTSVGIKLKSIDIVLNTMVKMVEQTPALQDKSYILSVVENEFMMSALFIHGVYVFANRSRLFAARGTDAFCSEILDKIGSMIQFNRSEQRTEEIESAYFYGLTEREISLCRQMAGSLSISIDEMPDCVAVSCPSDTANAFSMSDYFFPIGGLIRKRGM